MWKLRCAVSSGLNRRSWASLRARSTEKETLMANMGLPSELDDSDAEVRRLLLSEPAGDLKTSLLLELGVCSFVV